MIKLNKLQQKAFNDFVKNRCVVITAPRRSGKTMLLKYIVEKYPRKRFGVYCNNFRMFKYNFGMYKNCHYKNNDSMYEADILLGDEFIVHDYGRPSISVITEDINITKWINPYKKSTLKHILTHKKQMPKKMWENEFGNYLTN
jgi:AAA+ ATPase superfamily predicted ATPase